MKNKSSEKLRYTKPKIEEVRFAADEVFALGCKSAPGPGSGKNRNPCKMPSCKFDPGS